MNTSMIEVVKPRQKTHEAGEFYPINKFRKPQDPTAIPRGVSYSRISVRNGKIFKSIFDWDNNRWGTEFYERDVPIKGVTTHGS